MARLTDANVPQRDDGLASANRKAEPYMAACHSLVGSVAGFTFLGYWLDRTLGHSVLWLLVVGAVFGMVVGFVSFFLKIAQANRLAAPRNPADDARRERASSSRSGPGHRRGRVRYGGHALRSARPL